MDIEEFDFELPARLIAQKPMVPRDASRLLQVGAALEDHQFSDLPGLLAPGDILVFNDTRVIPARLDAMRGAAAIEITLTKELGATRWRALARPAKRLSEGDRLVFAQDFAATVAAKGEGGEITIDFEAPQGRVRAALEAHGRMPLPPYIKRPKVGAGKAQATDHSDYQTIYARRDGAIAAPTAGLHFTPQLIDALSARGILGASVTLHVGAGTFLPVTSARVEDHVMHGEAGMIQHASAAAINAARREGGRIIAVGTTSLRLIESAAAEDGTIRPFAGDTNLFITPGYRFKAVDGLITNFHLPRSTLYILVSAFAGSSRMRAAYEHAKAAGYRFYSYGDSSLLFPERPR